MTKHITKSEVAGLSSSELKIRMKMFQAKSPDPEVVTITPEEAISICEEYNGFNRPVDWNIVHYYASQMKEGLWQINGEAIILSDQGELLDGQHRLYACVEAGVPFRTILVKGISKEAFKTINTGKKRTGRDIFTINALQKGEPVGLAGPLSIAAGICIEYDRGWIKKKGTDGCKISPQEKLAFAEATPKLTDWVNRAREKKSPIKRYASMIAAVAFMGSRKYEMKAGMFVDGVLSGAMLEARNPMLILHQKFANRGGEERFRRWEKIAYIILAWNKLVDNERISLIKLPRDADIPDIAGYNKYRMRG